MTVFVFSCSVVPRRTFVLLLLPPAELTIPNAARGNLLPLPFVLVGYVRNQVVAERVQDGRRAAMQRAVAVNLSFVLPSAH